VNLLRDNIELTKKNIETAADASKEVPGILLVVNAGQRVRLTISLPSVSRVSRNVGASTDYCRVNTEDVFEKIWKKPIMI
jgi:hypothetical protein